jgi:hypothetical protein
MSTTTEPRKPPSWIWNMDDATRRALLTRRTSKGDLAWKLEEIPIPEILRTPYADASDLELARLGLLAELNELPESRECSGCGISLGAVRGAVQTCESCHDAKGGIS